VKIDTDRFIGPEQASVRADGEQVGHVTTAEYGSQMLALGGVRHITGGNKREGVVACDTLLALCNKQPVELSVDGGAKLTIQAGAAPVIDGVREERMRVRLRLGDHRHVREGSGTVMSTRSSSSTTTSPACSPSIRPAASST